MSNNAKPGEFCWNELMTGDAKQAKSFYKSLFGWDVQDHDMGGFTYTLLKKNDKDVGGMMQIPQEQSQHIPPHWMSYVCVDDAEAIVEQAKSLGATIVKEPTSIANVGIFALIQDPTGAHIAVWQSTHS